MTKISTEEIMDVFKKGDVEKAYSLLKTVYQHYKSIGSEAPSDYFQIHLLLMASEAKAEGL